MKATACIFTPATALSRVFLSSTGPRQTSLVAGSRKYTNAAGNSYTSRHGSAVLMARLAAHPQGKSASTSPRRCIYQGTPPRWRSEEGFARRPNDKASRPDHSQGGSRPQRPQQRGSLHLATAKDFFGDNADAGNEEGASQRPRQTAGGSGGRGGAANGDDIPASTRKHSNAIPGLAERVKGKVRMPRDRDIASNYVILQNADGSLSAPVQTSTVLRGLHRITESLVMLSYANTDGPRSDPQSRFPICVVVNRIEERKQEADLRAAARKKGVAKKELELAWGIDTHDLGHRLKKLKGFLEKGLLVEMTLMRKKGKRVATLPEAKELLKRIRETIAAVPGAKETKPMEGELLHSVRLAIQGPSAKKKKELGT